MDLKPEPLKLTSSDNHSPELKKYYNLNLSEMGCYASEELLSFAKINEMKIHQLLGSTDPKGGFREYSLTASSGCEFFFATLLT